MFKRCKAIDIDENINNFCKTFVCKVNYTSNKKSWNNFETVCLIGNLLSLRSV